MPYLIAQILFCLLVAVALGAIVGWLVKDLLARRKLRQTEELWQGRLRRTEMRVGSIKNQLVEEKQIEEELRAELHKARQPAAAAAAEPEPDTLEELRAELTQRDKKIGLLKLQVSQSEAALTSEWESLKALKTELAERQRRLDTRDKQRETSWANRLKESEELRQKQRRQLAQLKQRLDGCEEKLATARRELEDPRQTAAKIEEIAVELAARDVQVARLTKALAQAQTRARGAAPPSADDLTQIRGIGPVLQRKLNQFGVTTFSQIAAWTEEDVDRVGSELGAFSGRIRRDRWIESAKELQ